MNNDLRNSNPAVMLHLQRLARQFISDCELKVRRLDVARTMREVNLSATAIARGEIRYMPEVRTAKQALLTGATDRMRALLKPQIKALEQCEDLDEFNQAHARLIQNDWNFLRGDYASVHHEATRAAQLLRGALVRKALGPAADRPLVDGLDDEVEPMPTRPRPR
jgi:hypothetical protein